MTDQAQETLEQVLAKMTPRERLGWFARVAFWLCVITIGGFFLALAGGLIAVGG